MLGELVFESTGKRLVRRAITTEPPTVEVSFEENGKLLGASGSGFGTYTSKVRPDGSLYGEGGGGFMTTDGDLVVWKGSGVGKFKERGAVSYRGIVYYQTASPKLARLNGMAGVFEHEVDPQGNIASKIWEWK